MTYRALPSQPGLMSTPVLDQISSLSLLAIGVFCYLRWHGATSIDQLGKANRPATSYLQMKAAIDELIELGLVEEILEAEAVGEVSA